MLKTLLSCSFLSIAFLVSGQEKLAITALNRFDISKNDTTQEFYARIPLKKDRIKKGKLYYWYNGDSIMNTREGISGRVLDGRYTVYYPNRNLKEQGQFSRGLKDGSWKTWKENGELIAVEKWNKGERIEKKIKAKKKKKIKPQKEEHKKIKEKKSQTTKKKES